MHTTIEEETFFPAVRELTDTQLADVVAEGIQEHHMVNVLADEIAGVEAGSEEWAAKMRSSWKASRTTSKKRRTTCSPKSARPPMPPG